jgi:hypothetical protein
MNDTPRTSRIIGTADPSGRTRTIFARYAHLAYRRVPLLDHFSLDEIMEIGNILLSAEDRGRVLAFPYSFGDLYLYDRPALQEKYDGCDFPLQCRILDVAWEYARATDLFALVAIDRSTDDRLLLSISSDPSRLYPEATDFLSDPLLDIMVDRNSERNLHDLIVQAQAICEGSGNTERTGVYRVRCSDAFYVSNLFLFPLDCRFSVRYGMLRDRFGHPIPESFYD